MTNEFCMQKRHPSIQAPSFAPVMTNTPQKNCSRCGTSVMGNHEDNIKKQSQKSMESRLGHDFNSLRIYPESVQVNHPLVSHQVRPDEKETDKDSENGLPMAFAGSGTCVNGGGSSNCDLATGKFIIKKNDNTCCTKDCTQQHEQQHVTDHNSWGCCAALSAAWTKSGANKVDIMDKYKAWFASANEISECNAYNNDVNCADALSKSKDCSGAGKGTDCCKDIEDYRARYSAEAKNHCDKAPKKVPPCPSF